MCVKSEGRTPNLHIQWCDVVTFDLQGRGGSMHDLLYTTYKQTDESSTIEFINTSPLQYRRADMSPFYVLSL